jgi:hypothetical protein
MGFWVLGDTVGCDDARYLFGRMGRCLDGHGGDGWYGVEQSMNEVQNYLIELDTTE